jgi:pimeloyl-ACP methyl ester carboxylesterase
MPRLSIPLLCALSFTMMAACPGRCAQEFLVNGHHLRLYCDGQGPGPTIILESGFGMTLESWKKTQTEVAKFAKVCSYDRAEKTSNVIDDLHTLLAEAHLHSPYILVGHSIGGIYIRAFTSRFPSEVAGLVFVDSSHEEQRWRMQEITKRKTVSSINSGFLAPGKLLKWHFDIPIIVIEHGRPERRPDFTEEQSESFETLWHSLQADLAGRSKYGKLVTAEQSGHMIPLQEPSIVIRSIRDVLQQVDALTRSGRVSGSI